jgi:SAM-dependent methyltransferase
MRGYQSDSYGERFADTYDEFFSEFTPSQHQIELLRKLAAGGHAVEIGVGTGRVALPLARAGVQVVGIDTSGEMLDRLARKATGLPVRMVHGDVNDIDADSLVGASLVYVVFNTFFMIAGTDAQVTCLRRVREMLADDGALVIEVFVPRPERFVNGQDIRIKRLTVNEVVLQVSQHHPTDQRVDSQDVVLRHGDPVELFPTQVHYHHPDQLDALAERCGFTLEARHAGWAGELFDATSGTHVSVYRAARVKEANTWA